MSQRSDYLTRIKAQLAKRQRDFSADFVARLCLRAATAGISAIVPGVQKKRSRGWPREKHAAIGRAIEGVGELARGTPKRRTRARAR